MPRACLGVLLCLSLNLVAQDDDKRKGSLQVTPQWNGKKLKLSGTVDLPDNTVLRIMTKQEVERMLHQKVECKLYVDYLDSYEIQKCEVNKKKFSIEIDMPVPGVYQYSIGYARLEQLDPAVLKVLGDGYLNWSRDFSAVLFDPRSLISQLTDERPKILDFLAEMKKVGDMITQEFRRETNQRDFKAIDKEIIALEKKVLDFKAKSLHGATSDVLYEALQKMKACSPTVTKLGFPPGSPEAEHAAEGQTDIPQGVNDEWSLELVWAYLARGRRAVDRERHLVPLRYAKARWDGYLQLIRIDSVTDKQLDAAKADWETAVECVKDNCKTISAELPDDKKKRTSEEAAFGDWCELTPGVLAAMTEYAARRRAARGASNEEKERLDTEGEKEALKTWESLNTSIRKVASRP